MYLVTGGRKTQSALYRVSCTASQPNAAETSAHERDCAAHAAAARRLRQSLEALHKQAEPAACDTAWPLLGHADPAIRHAARIAIEHQSPEVWRQRALAEERPIARLTAWLMLLEAEGPAAAIPVLNRLQKLRPAELRVLEQRLLLHAYGVLRAAAPQLFAASREQIVGQWDGEFAVSRDSPLHVGQLGNSGEVRRELARLLVDLQAPQAIERTAAVLLASRVQEDRIMGLLALAGVKQGWSPATRRAQFTALADAGKFVGGEGMPQFIKRLREEAEAALSDDERRQLADLLATPTTEPDLILPERPLVKQWKPADIAPLLADAKRRGDAQRGAAVFQDALCVRCHRVGARGPAVGPDLTHVAGRFSRQDILQSVLTPAAVVAESYRNVQVLLTDGRTLVGRALVEGDYRSEKLRLAVNPLKPSEIVEISKREIVQSRQVETSPMPSVLLDTFNEQAVLDLLAYLEAGAAVK